MFACGNLFCLCFSGKILTFHPSELSAWRPHTCLHILSVHMTSIQWQAIKCADLGFYLLICEKMEGAASMHSLSQRSWAKPEAGIDPAANWAVIHHNTHWKVHPTPVFFSSFDYVYGKQYINQSSTYWMHTCHLQFNTIQFTYRI